MPLVTTLEAPSIKQALVEAREAPLAQAPQPAPKRADLSKWILIGLGVAGVGILLWEEAARKKAQAPEEPEDYTAEDAIASLARDMDDEVEEVLEGG